MLIWNDHKHPVKCNSVLQNLNRNYNHDHTDQYWDQNYGTVDSNWFKTQKLWLANRCDINEDGALSRADDVTESVQ